MPATISHQLSATTPDDPNYEIQVKHWNSVHAVTLSAVGSEIIGAFSNLNGLSFGTEPSGKITGSYTVPSVPAQSIQTQNMVSVQGSTGSVVFANANNVTFGFNASTITASASYSQSTAPSSIVGSNATYTSGAVVFTGSNAVTVRSAAGQKIIIDVPVQTTQTDGFVNSVSVVGNTAGNTSAGTGSIVFAGGPNITLSGSTAAGGMTLSVSAAAAAAGGATIQSYWNPDTPAGSFAVSDAALSLLPFFIGGNMTVTRCMLLGHLTQTNSSTSAASSGALSISLGLYTMSGSTASLASSGSTAYTWTTGTNSTQSTANQYVIFSGTRYRDLTVGSWAVTPGNYLMGVWIRTSNAGSWTWFGNSSYSLVSHVFTSQTAQYLPGFSTSSFTTGMPASVNVTNVNYVRTGASANRQVYFQLMGSV